jgi:hypothetical protein
VSQWVSQILSQVWLELKDHNLLISTGRSQVTSIYLEPWLVRDIICDLATW